MLALFLLHLKVSLEAERQYRPYIFDAGYSLPSSNVIRTATLNYRPAAADLVWVSGVQFVAKSVIAHRTADSVTYYAKTLIDLDPYFYKIYSWHSAARMLAAGYPTPEDIEAANDILELGMKYFPQDWQLPQEAVANYIGFNHGVDAHIRMRQLERGIEFADEAAARSGGRDVPVFLAVRFRRRLMDLKRETDQTQGEPVEVPEADPDMLVRLYFQATSKVVRDSILSRLQRIGDSSRLAEKLRSYSRRQATWYESSSASYLPIELLAAVDARSSFGRTGQPNHKEKFP